MRTFRVFVMLLALGSAAAAEAKSYSADRFDSRVEVLQGGALRITETVVFRFEGGPYKEVFRHLRTRDTDGVDVVSASMDGVAFPRGEQPGTVQVSGDSRIRITWRFAPVADSTHTFELTYVMHGVVQRQGAADVLRWTALPVDHKYRIASSTISIDLPASPVAEPKVDSRRVNGQTLVEVNDARLRITATELRSDGWIRVTARMPQGSVIASPPAWQEKVRRQSASAPMWMAAGGVVLAAGLILLFSVRQGYDPPPRDRTTPSVGPALPDTLTPAEAGAVIANGTPGMAHAMATLFALAERGELTINEETKRAWGQRHFTVLRRSAHRPVATYEQVVLDVIFTDKDQAQDSVPLDKARSRLTRHFKRFRRALENELNAHRLLDADRAAVRHRFGVVSVVSLLIAGCVALPLAILALDTYGGWPLIIPAALAILAFVSLICHASHTKLSNEGVRRARYWRGFRDYLKEVAHDRTPVPASGIDRLVPYAVALGIADGWARFLKKHKRPVPSWFNAAAAGDSAPAFVAFVAYSGVTAGGGAGGHGGAGGAGGGASGAG
jgi:hypothetical protein